MIWCVEDDAGIRDIEVYTLKSTGFEAEGFRDGAAMFAALESAAPELILLDIMLPDADGTEILKRLRRDPKTAALPVIMATAKGEEYDKVMSLDLGADDYLVKPFGMMEMVSRVKAVLRRSGRHEPEKVLSVGALALDEGKHTVTAAGARVELTLKEYELLRLFLTRPGQVFTRDMLFNAVWDADFADDTRTVDVHIRTLRSKLGACAGLIKTVRGVGYKLEESADD